ncbi:MAG: hypothetical protein K6D54_07940 [Bacteroidales bacterium]|nr:hypothetical protein [Bacteroidales bacterium]
MKKILYSLLAAAALLQACTLQIQEPEIVTEIIDPLAGKMVIHATLEEGTKTGMSDMSVVWLAGDQIRVYNEANPSGVVFTLDPASAGSVNGSFVGDEISGTGPYYAVYPAADGGMLFENLLGINLPETQLWANSSFGNGANPAVAYAADLENLPFKNVCGVLNLRLTGSATISGVRLYTAADERLCGTGYIEMTYGADGPVLNLTGDENLSVDSHVLTLTSESGVALSETPIDFRIVVPAGCLASGFHVEIIDDAGESMIKRAPAAANNRVNRAKMRSMPSFAYTAQYGPFLQSNQIGIVDGCLAGGSNTTLRALGSGDQFAWAKRSAIDRSFRMQSWSTGYAIELTTTDPNSFGSMQMGKAYAFDIKAMGATNGVSTATGTAVTLVKKWGETAWFVDGSNRGYTIKMKED